MAKQAAGAAGIEKRISRLFPGMVWPAFPWLDGSPDIPIDLDVAGPLVALFPEWAGNWDDFAPCLRQHGYTLPELPHVSIKIVSAVAAAQAQENLERRAARGLTLSAGSGTSVSTFYSPGMVAPIAARPAAEDDETAAVVKRIKGMRRLQILLVMRIHGAVSAATAIKKAEIADAVQAIDPRAGRAFKKPFRFLGNLGLADSGTSGCGGHWLTPEGIRAADYIEQHVSGMEYHAKQIRRAAG